MDSILQGLAEGELVHAISRPCPLRKKSQASQQGNKSNSYGQKNSIYVVNLYLLGVGEMVHWVKSFLRKQRKLTSGSHGTYLRLSLWGGGAALTHWLVIWEDPGQ